MLLTAPAPGIGTRRNCNARASSTTRPSPDKSIPVSEETGMPGGVGVGGRHRLHSVAGVGQKLDRVGEHLVAGLEDLADHPCRNAILGHLHRRLDHRQHEALDAVAVAVKVPFLGGEKPLVEVIAGGVVREDIGESLLRQDEEALVVPERVVGVEADGRDVVGLGRGGWGGIGHGSVCCRAVSALFRRNLILILSTTLTPQAPTGPEHTSGAHEPS